jgi:hypothetical protein
MTSKLFIVYRITNILTHKHYYGYKSCSKRDPKDILGKTYFSSSSDKEFIAEQKNHPERFRYKIVAKFSTKEEALQREIRLHTLFDVGLNDSFYNRSKQTSDKFDMTGFRHSEETKRRISLAGKGRPHTSEHRKRISESLTGTKHSDLTRSNMREAKKRSPMSEEGRRKLSELKRGKPMSEETRKKMSESKIGKKRGPASDETKRKISESLKNRNRVAQESLEKRNS